ncbi:MAG: hypothetical protein IPL32_00080 [Chloracidobacterium sp.]|nr:hypothetical protein [Chloracidobacterium sp.]
MNVFEDLIVELKEENLLENTVIDAAQKKKPLQVFRKPQKSLTRTTGSRNLRPSMMR